MAPLLPHDDDFYVFHDVSVSNYVYHADALRSHRSLGQSSVLIISLYFLLFEFLGSQICSFVVHLPVMVVR